MGVCVEATGAVETNEVEATGETEINKARKNKETEMKYEFFTYI